MVAVDREACAKYKQALDKLLPPEWTEAVYTENAADVVDRPLVAELQLSDEREEDVRLLFKKADKDPKILIVTDKLLTGYDAPLLYCLYLDKPMRDHVLLQAIARVNRPYVDTEGIQKRVGLVVDFVGVLRELKKALQFDSSDVDGVIEDLDLLMQRLPRQDREGEGRLSRCRRRRRRRRAPGTPRLWPLPRAGATQGVLRSLQGHREPLGNPVAVDGARRPHRHVQAPGAALCRGAQCLCRQDRFRRRSRLQDAATGRTERDAGGPRPA